MGGWKQTRFAATALAAAWPLLAQPVGRAPGQCQYELVTLQYPIACGVGTVITDGLSINEQGAVVGSYKCPLSKYFQGYLWTPEGGFVGLQPPPGTLEVIPTDINDLGVICGTMIDAQLGYRGFVYEDGQWTILPPVVEDSGWSSAAAISNAGVVVGQRSITGDVSPQNAFTWSRTGGFQDLGIPFGLNSGAKNLNDRGQVIGWTGTLGDDAVLWDDQKLTLLDHIPGGFTSTANGINNDGTIAGGGRLIDPVSGESVAQAHFWQQGVWGFLGAIPGYMHSGARAINDVAQIVGSCTSGDNPSDRRAFIWQYGTMFDLNLLIDSPRVSRLERPWAVNNAGQMVILGESPATNVAFVLTPMKVIGDVDIDCTVGVRDLLMLLAHWGQCPSSPTCIGDLDDDSMVNQHDLALILDNWG